MGRWDYGIIVCISWILCFTSSSYANVDMQILPGFDGYHKYGNWLPLRFTLTSEDRDIAGEIVVEIPGNAAEARYSSPVDIFKVKQKTQYLYILLEGVRRNFIAKLMDKPGEEVLRKDVSITPVATEDLIILVLTDSSGGLEFLSDIMANQVNTNSRRIYVSYLPIEFLPDKWKAYDSVNVMVLGDISPSSLSVDQRLSITDWVHSGGTLVVSGGAFSQNLIGSFIEELLPVKITGTRVLNSTDSLEKQFGQNIAGARIVVASSELANGGRAIVSESDGLPIIAERGAGYGKVVFLAFDYLDPAIRKWDGKRTMWEHLLPIPGGKWPAEDKDIIALLSTFNSPPLPYKDIGLYLLLYVLCFALVFVMLGKLETRTIQRYLTILGVIFVFATGALVFLRAAGRGTTVADFSVVDVYQKSGRARAISYFGLKKDCIMKFPASKTMFVNRISSTNERSIQPDNYRLIETDGFQMEIRGIKPSSLPLFYGESYFDMNGSVSIDFSENPDMAIYGNAINKLPFDLSDCYVFSNGRNVYIGDLIRGKLVDFTQARKIPSPASKEDRGKQRFFNSMRQGLSQLITGTGVVGWMEDNLSDESALKTLVEMDMGRDYKVLGATLVIVHL